MTRELYEADITSTRKIVETFISIVTTGTIGAKPIRIEAYMDTIRNMTKKEEIPNALWDVYRACDLVKQLENGAFIPSNYDDHTNPKPRSDSVSG